MATKKKPVLNTLAAQFASQPALVAEDMKSQFETLIAGAVEHEYWSQLEANATRMSGDDFWECDEWEAQFRPYEVNADGILFVPVRGVLLHNYPYQLGNWATGYIYIQKAIERGLADYNVKAIALLINSPGGMVAGCFEAVDKIFERRGEKPIRAFAHESAYSAAYAIASVADHIVVSRTGGVGSIGVVTSHVDWSKFNEDFGIKYTFIFAGKHKVDGNPEEPLSADAKERIQTRIDEMYDVFVSTVSRNRGMEEQAVRDTEALTFTATQAVSNGLADSIGPLDDAVAQFCVELSTPQTGDEAMSNTTDNTTAVVEQAAHEQAVNAARAEGIKEGAAAAQKRIGEILGLDEATGRETLASHFAFNTDMAVDAVKAALAAAPKAVAETATTTATETPGASFTAAMSTGNPEVGAGNVATETAEGDQPDTLAMLKSLGVIG